MYKNDGKERNEDSLFGHVLEYQMSLNKIQTFKSCIIEGWERDVEYFSSYDRNESVYRLILDYNQSMVKSADCIKDCTEEAFQEMNHYIETWLQTDLESKLVKAFGRANLASALLNNRVTGFGHNQVVVR